MSGDMRICPNCGSTNVEPDTTTVKALGGVGATNSWRCNECDFAGPMPQGSPEKGGDEEFGSESEEYSRLNTYYNYKIDLILSAGFALLLTSLIVLDKIL